MDDSIRTILLSTGVTDRAALGERTGLQSGTEALLRQAVRVQREPSGDVRAPANELLQTASARCHASYANSSSSTMRRGGMPRGSGIEV